MEHKMFIIILPKFYPQAYLALSDVQITDVWDVRATTCNYMQLHRVPKKNQAPKTLDGSNFVKS